MIDFRQFAHRLRKWFVALLHLDDSTHRIALGAAAGVFVALTPTLGLQIVLVLFLLWIIPGNRAAGVPMVFITNPATAVPIYYFNYRVGAWILGHRMVDVRGLFKEFFRSTPGWGEFAVSPVAWIGHVWRWIGEFWRAMEGVMAPLWLGSAVVAIAGALVIYVLMYYLVDFYRKRLIVRLHRLASLREIRRRRHHDRRHRKADRNKTSHPTPPPPEAEANPPAAAPEKPSADTGRPA